MILQVEIYVGITEMICCGKWSHSLALRHEREFWIWYRFQNNFRLCTHGYITKICSSISAPQVYIYIRNDWAYLFNGRSIYTKMTTQQNKSLSKLQLLNLSIPLIVVVRIMAAVIMRTMTHIQSVLAISIQPRYLIYLEQLNIVKFISQKSPDVPIPSPLFMCFPTYQLGHHARSPHLPASRIPLRKWLITLAGKSLKWMYPTYTWLITPLVTSYWVGWSYYYLIHMPLSSHKIPHKTLDFHIKKPTYNVVPQFVC